MRELHGRECFDTANISRWSSCACMKCSKYLNVEYLTFRTMQSWSHLKGVSSGSGVGFITSLANMDLHFRKPAYTGGRF